MRTRLHPMSFLAIAIAIAACSPTPQPPAPAAAPAAATESPDAAPAAPGSDRDAHGCIGSAGYAWCARISECARPWELAEREDLERSPEAFDAWCGTPADG